MDGREDGLEASGSNHHWRRSIGLNEAPKTPSRREGDQRRKVGVLRRGTQGGEREHPEECFGYGEAYYGMWSSGRFGDVADVDGKDKEDENEDKQQEGNGRDGARFCSQVSSEGVKVWSLFCRPQGSAERMLSFLALGASRTRPHI